MEGIVGNNDLNEIKECMVQDDKLQQLIEEATELIKSNRIEDITNGIKKFGKAIHRIPSVLSNCDTIKDDI